MSLVIPTRQLLESEMVGQRSAMSAFSAIYDVVIVDAGSTETRQQLVRSEF